MEFLFSKSIIITWILFPIILCIYFLLFRLSKDADDKKILVALTALLFVLFAHYTRLEELILQNYEMINLLQQNQTIISNTAETVEQLNQAHQEP